MSAPAVAPSSPDTLSASRTRIHAHVSEACHKLTVPWAKKETIHCREGLCSPQACPARAHTGEAHTIRPAIRRCTVHPQRPDALGYVINCQSVSSAADERIQGRLRGCVGQVRVQQRRLLIGQCKFHCKGNRVYNII
jgi:hypothetical protein